MRMVRAGLMPMELAAAMSDVVLNGAGGLDLRRFFSMVPTVASLAPAMRAMTASASSLSLKRAVACVAVKASS